MTPEETQSEVDPLLAAARTVTAAFDAASDEKYDELSWQKFCELGGVEPLRKLLPA